MKKQISITTNNPLLHGFLNADTPIGVKIISEPPTEGRGVDFGVVINIDFVIDLARISEVLFFAWLIKRSERIRGKHTVNIHNKQIPIDDPEAIELIAKGNEDKKSD
jgi:hypothetical protein